MNPLPFASLSFRFPRGPLALGIALACTPALAVEAPADSDDGDRLDTIVVTAGGYEQLIADAPASISVISREELEVRPFVDLQDALRGVEGVSLTGSNVNRTDIQLRGMPGNYTLILVDGLRQSTRENSSREDIGATQAAQIPPLEAVERIEIVRGPMSSLYGSDAIGGVVNIITRKPDAEWTGALNLDTTVQEHSDLGNRRGGNFYIGGPFAADRARLQVYGNVDDRTEAEHVDGAYDRRDEGATARLTLALAQGQEVVLEAGSHELQFHATPGQTIATPAALDLDYERRHYTLGHDGQWSFGSSHLALYREVGETDHRVGEAVSNTWPRNRIANTTFEGNLTLPFDVHTLIAGAQYQHSELSGMTNEGNGNTIDAIDNSSWALFAEDEFRPLDALSLTGGMRYTHDGRYGGNWSPRIYAIHRLSDHWSLRGGVSRAFRAPTLRQTAPEYASAEGVGQIGVPSGRLPGNPDLRPETGTSSEIGIRYEGDPGFVAALTVFDNDFRNKIFSQCVEGCDGTTGALYAWGNIGRASIRGAEASVGWSITERLRLDANYPYTDSERRSDEEIAFNRESLRGQPLDRTPRHALNLRADWRFSDALSSYLAINASSEQFWANFRNSAQSVRRRPGTTTYDVGASYAFGEHVKLRTALLNLTDKRAWVDRRNRLTGLDGNWQVDDGRRVWLSLGLGF